MTDINILGEQAQKSSFELSKLSSYNKNLALKKVAESLEQNYSNLIEANKLDIEMAKSKNIKESLIDRLLLTKDRIFAMADGLRKMVTLEDPIGEMLGMKVRPNGLKIGQKRVPLGVIGIIYESRPNVTIDAFGLCFKTSNAVILRGGSDAINSNIALINVVQNSLESLGISKNCVQLIEDTSRETAISLMKLNNYLDVLIPRGGRNLIQSVIQNSTVPVIETGVGNCHIYIDEFADFHKALKIVINAKTQRTGVCNAAESLVVHKNVAEKFLPLICEELEKNNVQIRGDKLVQAVVPTVKSATEEDWGKEYLDKIISIKVVKNIDEAIHHINKYNTKHSEAIITENYTNSQQFLDEIDAAAVYVNASTRFTDGYEFGFGGEIGISTQKLHARGPMGLKELTTTKYVIFGSGQIRE